MKTYNTNSNKEGTPSEYGIQLKRTPEDFQVFEVQNNSEFGKRYNVEESKYKDILLIKRNMSTFEAVDILANKLHIDKKLIGYSGMKDEEAVTTQHITVPSKLYQKDYHISSEYGKILSTSLYGYREYPLQVGDLAGNSFKIKIRNIKENLADLWPRVENYHIDFINYYDTQRFGVPGGSYNTHLIGMFIGLEEYDLAFELLKNSGSKESALAKLHEGTSESFFLNILDPRVIAFYQSSYYSFIWNKNIGDKIKSIGETNEVSRHGINYVFPKTQNINFIPDKENYTTVRVIGDKIHYLQRERLVKIGVNMIVSDLELDALNQGSFSSTIQFFLPSGSYATMVIEQFLQTLFLQGREHL